MKIHVPINIDKNEFDEIACAMNSLLHNKVIKDYELLSKDLYIFFDNSKIKIGKD
jgi:hypothetical protein